MRPDISYQQLVCFIHQIAEIGEGFTTSPYASGTGSQQLERLVAYTQALENRHLNLTRIVHDARQMLTHTGNNNGNIKPKPHTLSGK